MLAERFVAIAADGFETGKIVEIAVPEIRMDEISEIEHVGSGLLRFRYPGLEIDHYVIAEQVLGFRIRPRDF